MVKMAESKMEEFFTEKDVQMYSRGDVLRGRVLQVNETGVLVDIGYKSEAQMRRTDLAPFRNQEIAPGEEIEVLVTYIDEDEGTVYVSEKQAIYEKRIGELERIYRDRGYVKGFIEDVVKDAGYHVNLNGIRAFLPGSHLGNDLPADIGKLRGQEATFAILELDRREKNLVVSHKRYLQDQERQRLDQIFSQLEVGQVVEGQVKSIVEFGLFVDIGGFEGLVHRSEISWKDLPAPPSSYKVGDPVTVKILDFDRKRQRISLSIKRLRPDPWIDICERYPVGQVFSGEVVSITNFGAFVRLEPDVEGLVHISELSWGYPEDPHEVVQVGQTVKAVVLDCNKGNRRISLSMRRAEPDPWALVEEHYPQGAVVMGAVTKLTDFGAFVQLEDGIEALLHISEMSWEHVARPGDVVQPGDQISAKVLKADGAKRKIRLSLRALQEDPWHKFLQSFQLGSIVEGPISEIKDFGAFLKLTDEVEGLIHVSEVSDERIATPAELLKVGQVVKARIIGINEEKRQVRLSMRNLEVQEQQEHALEEAGPSGFTMRELLKGKSFEETN